MSNGRKKPKVHLTVSLTQDAYEIVDDYMVDMNCKPSQAIESLLKQARAYQVTTEAQKEMKIAEKVKQGLFNK